MYVSVPLDFNPDERLAMVLCALHGLFDGLRQQMSRTILSGVVMIEMAVGDMTACFTPTLNSIS